MNNLPWIDSFLKPIREEYSSQPPVYTKSEITREDYDYILKNAIDDDPFDKSNLKKATVEALEQNKATVEKTTCEYGEIMIVSMKASPLIPTWNTWWRAIRLLSPKKPVRILIYGHPKKRTFPQQSTTNIGAEHVNGGSAMRCDPRTIVIHRKEEATRVLIHELFHASCSDPYYKDTPFIEADTEAWAELLLCAMAAKGNPNKWQTLMKQQIDWAVRQAQTLQNKYNVQGAKDYAWRYIIGRIHVWQTLGIQVSTTNKQPPVKSLRFTICEPENV